MEPPMSNDEIMSAELSEQWSRSSSLEKRVKAIEEWIERHSETPANLPQGVELIFINTCKQNDALDLFYTDRGDALLATPSGKSVHLRFELGRFFGNASAPRNFMVNERAVFDPNEGKIL